MSDLATDPHAGYGSHCHCVDVAAVALLADIRDRLARIEVEIETYRYLLPDPDSITGRALAGKARRAQRRQGG